MLIHSKKQWISSKIIAEETGKLHHNVMRDVKKLISKGAISPINFDWAEYSDEQGKKRPMYLLDFEAMMTLITGYNARLRNKVIKRWMALEQGQELPMAGKDVLLSQIEALRELRLQQLEIQQKVRHQEKEIAQISRQIASIQTAENYFTIIGYANFINRPVDLNTAQLLGKRASRLCYENGFVMGTVPDPRYGRVKTYPVDVLKKVFEDYFNREVA